MYDNYDKIVTVHQKISFAWNSSPAVWIEKDDVAPRKLVIRGDKKSSPRERSPTDSVDNASYEATEELDVSKRVDMSAGI